MGGGAVRMGNGEDGAWARGEGIEERREGRGQRGGENERMAPRRRRPPQAVMDERARVTDHLRDNTHSVNTHTLTLIHPAIHLAPCDTPALPPPLPNPTHPPKIAGECAYLRCFMVFRHDLTFSYFFFLLAVCL